MAIAPHQMAVAPRGSRLHSVKTFRKLSTLFACLLVMVRAAGDISAASCPGQQEQQQLLLQQHHPPKYRALQEWNVGEWCTKTYYKLHYDVEQLAAVGLCAPCYPNAVALGN